MAPIDKVLVWIIKGSDVLLLKTIVARGGKWQPVTGWVDAGEAAEAAAIREVLEETGIALAAGSLLALGEPTSFTNRGRLVREQAFAACIADEEREIQPDPNEHSQWKWVDPETAMHDLPFLHQQDSLRAAMRLTLEPALKD